MRFSQHLTAYRSKANFMWQHVAEVHEGVVGDEPRLDFAMTRKNIDPDPIRRILRESVHITHLRELSTAKPGEVVSMNGKEEWFGVKIVQPSFTQE